MKLQLLVTADLANIEDATNKLNILGVFNRIYASQFPTIRHRMVVVIKIVADDPSEPTEPRPIVVRVSDQDGHDLFQVTGQVALPIDAYGRRQDADIVLELNGFEFPRSGIYGFYVLAEDQSLGDTRIEVIQA